MFDCLEGDDSIKRGVGERQRRAVGATEFKIRHGGIETSGVLDRLGGNVGADHVPCMTGQERAAVTGTARDVEHVAPGDKRCRKMIAVPMLVPDLAAGSREESLAGELELFAHSAVRPRRKRRMIGPRQATSRASHGQELMKRRMTGGPTAKGE